MNCSDHHKIALFGGTFDPVHNGHLAAARYVLSHCDLNSVFFTPAPHPPHKKNPVVSFQRRVDMLNIALLNESNMYVSLVESEYEGPSYTLKTVEILQQRNKKTGIYLIVGADSLVDLPHWYSSNELLEQVHLIVVGRDEQADSIKIQNVIKAFTPVFSYDDKNKFYISKHNTTITLLADFKWPASSSTVRKELVQGLCPSEISVDVYAYILEHNLYK